MDRYRRSGLARLLLALAVALPLSAGAALPPDPGKPSTSFDVGSLHFDVYGKPGKATLIFIPALFCGPWEWNGEIARFAPDHTIYAIALPGLAGRPPIASSSLLDTATGDFWRFLDEKHVAGAVVIGHSLGGTIALKVAEEHPDRLLGAVAVDGGVITSPGIDPNDPKLRASQVQRIANSIAQIPPAQFGSALRQNILPSLITSPSDVAAVAELGAKTDPLAAAQWLREALDLDLRPGLAKMDLPFLEVMPFDPLSDPQADPRYATQADKLKVYESMLSEAPLAEVVSIVPSRHFVLYDQPDELHDVLVTFLASIPGQLQTPSPSGEDRSSRR